jgi:ATP-binding cassette subfamily F protein 3
MISVNNLSVQFSGEPLFDHVSFIINDKDRMGLTGKNGAGKSTILKIIKGLHKADEGEIISPDGFTIGYLPQEMETGSLKSVYEEAMTAFTDLKLRLPGGTISNQSRTSHFLRNMERPSKGITSSEGRWSRST